MRHMLFLDTPDLVLNKAGVVVRVRRTQGREADSVIKLRPVVLSEVSSKLRKSSAFSIELDVTPTGFVCSADMKNLKIDYMAVKDVIASRLPNRKLFTKEQRSVYSEHAPQALELDSLRTPRTHNRLQIEVLAARFRSQARGRTMGLP